MQQITEAELEVMKVLWSKNEATSQQITEELLQTTTWKPKTIQTLINRLVGKGAIKADKSNSKLFVYHPLITEGEYMLYVNTSFLQKMYNGSVNLMLSTFVKQQKISKKDIEELKKIIEEDK